MKGIIPPSWIGRVCTSASIRHRKWVCLFNFMSQLLKFGPKLLEKVHMASIPIDKAVDIGKKLLTKKL
jgi:hypothetical protein